MKRLDMFLCMLLTIMMLAISCMAVMWVKQHIEIGFAQANAQMKKVDFSEHVNRIKEQVRENPQIDWELIEEKYDQLQDWLQSLSPVEIFFLQWYLSAMGS